MSANTPQHQPPLDNSVHLRRSRRLRDRSIIAGTVYLKERDLMSAEQNKAAMKRIEEAFNTGDVSVVDEVVHEEHVDETPHPGDEASREGLKQQIETMRSAFPDAQFEITTMVAEEDWIPYA
jgi:hypothetical protein